MRCAARSPALSVCRPPSLSRPPSLPRPFARSLALPLSHPLCLCLSLPLSLPPSLSTSLSLSLPCRPSPSLFPRRPDRAHCRTGVLFLARRRGVGERDLSLLAARRRMRRVGWVGGRDHRRVGREQVYTCTPATHIRLYAYSGYTSRFMMSVAIIGGWGASRYLHMYRYVPISGTWFLNDP